MSIIQAPPGPMLPGNPGPGSGDTHQQRWLQDLERAWLRSWQQAEPAGTAASPRPAGPAATRPEAAWPARPAQPGALGAAPDAAADTVAEARPHPAGSAPDGVAGAAVQRKPAGAAQAAGHAPHSQAATGGGARDTTSSAQPASAPARSGLQQQHATARIGGSAPGTPPPGPSTASLHLREHGGEEVMAALRDSQLDPTASRAAAESLVRQLALAGYAQVQVYVNGTAVRRRASEPDQPPSAIPRKEKPSHGD